MNADTDTPGVKPSPPVADARHRRKEGQTIMTMNEKLKIHKEIVESNEQKLKEWKEGKAA